MHEEMMQGTVSEKALKATIMDQPVADLASRKDRGFLLAELRFCGVIARLSHLGG